MHELFISSTANQRIKDLIRLRDDKRLRRDQSRLMVEGLRECERAIQCGYELLEVYARENSKVLSALLRSQKSAEFFTVNKAVMTKLAMRDQDDALVCVFAFKATEIASNYSQRAALLVLDGMEKPGNLGAIYRSADAAGIARILISGGSVDRYNPHAIRASLGTIFAIPTLSEDEKELLNHLRANQFKIVVATPEAPLAIREIVYPQRCAFVVGSEAHGVSAFWRAHADYTVRIDMSGIADSLNASVTAALLAFSFRDKQ